MVLQKLGHSGHCQHCAAIAALAEPEVHSVAAAIEVGEAVGSVIPGDRRHPSGSLRLVLVNWRKV